MTDAGPDAHAGVDADSGVDPAGDAGDPPETVDNVVLLTVDALRADHVGHLGYDRETTPNLDALAARGRCYETCVAQSSHTRESMPSLFFSAYPFELGAVGPVPDDRPTLVTELSAAGLSTAGVHSNPYLSRAYGFDRGFDHFDDDLPLASNRAVAFAHRVVNHFRSRPYARAADLNADGLSWLDDTDGRRFLWLHYMDPHGPYQAPPRYQRVFSEAVLDDRSAKRLWRRTVDDPGSITDRERRRLVDLYDAEIRYVDAMIGALVEGLRDRDLLSETLVVVGADHGDLFGEHDRYGHPRRLYEQLIRVPLVVLGPEGTVAPGRVERPVENVDLAPTLLRAAGVDPPPAFAGRPLPIDRAPADVGAGAGRAGVTDGTDGESAGPDADSSAGAETDGSGADPRTGRIVFSEAHGEGEESDVARFVAHDGRHKASLVREGETVRRRATYDVAGDERTDVGDERPALRDRLHDALDDHVESVLGEALDDAADEVDSVVADRLEALGYR